MEINPQYDMITCAVSNTGQSFDVYYGYLDWSKIIFLLKLNNFLKNMPVKLSADF